MADTVITVEFTPFSTVQSTDIITVPSSTSSTAVTRLDALEDVVEGGAPIDKSTLVYDAATDKYIVKQMDLDGGSF